MKQSEARAYIESRVTVNEDGCWVWPNATGSYGHVKIKGKHFKAHRLAWLAYRGRIGKSHVLHKCDNPPCCNPDHLFLGTHQDNMADLVEKDRSGVRELRNPHGKLTDEQVVEIRRRHARGFPPSWIAKDFGISAAYVRDIVNRRPSHAGERPTRHHADDKSA